MQAFKDKSSEELRLADLKATSDLLPAPSTSPLKTNDEKASEDRKPEGGLTSALLSFPGAESASTTTWVVLSKDACAFVKLQDVARRAFALKKKTAPKLQALARGVAARNVVWRQKCSELKLRDRVIYAAASAGGSFSLKLMESTVQRFDYRGQCIVLLPTGASGDEVKRQSIRSLSLLSRVAAAAATNGKQGRQPSTTVWLLLSDEAVGKLHAPTAKVQALLRKRKVLFDVLPLAKQSAYRMFKERREKQLKALKAEQQKRAAADVSKLFSCIPSLPKFGSANFANAVSMMSSGSSGAKALDSPRQDALADLWAELESVVGLKPAKAWIRRFIDQSLRHFVAGEPYRMRHVIVEGGLGTGKSKAVELMAKAVHAMGLAPSSVITDVRKDSNGLVTGAVNRINLDSDDVSPGRFDSLVRRLEKSASASGDLALVVVSGKSRKTMEFKGGSIALCKREPDVVKLQPFSNEELAMCVMQQMIKKVDLSPAVTVELLAAAIEMRWSEGERRQRSVYLAHDMTEYLLSECTLNQVKGSLADTHLSSCRLLAGATGGQAMTTVHLVEEMKQCSSGGGGGGGGGGSGGSSKLELRNLNLPPSALASANADDVAEISKKLEEERLEKERKRAAIDDEIEKVVGMESAKKWFEDIRGKVRFVENGGSPSVLSECCLNMVLTGNPGTGKTTLARLIFKFLRAYGVLKKDRFVEANALELKGEYCGQTAPRVISTIRSAMGGCLFLDEAYGLAGKETFSQEAVRTLLTEVENNRTSVMVILAGYRDKMGQFMRADPGLPRRFPMKIHLGDYSPDQLVGIAKEKATQQHGLSFAKGVDEKLADAFGTVYASEVSQCNGGLAVRLVDEAVGRLANRVQRSFEALGSGSGNGNGNGSGSGNEINNNNAEAQAELLNEKTLTLADFDLESHFEKVQRDRDAAATKADEEMTALERARAADAEAERKRQCEAQRAALAELEAMIGFDDAKAYVKAMIRKIQFVAAGGNRKVLDTCRNLVLVGNPGVGKTTFARIVHKVLHAYGVVKCDTFVERNGLQLKGQYIGQTSPKVTEAFDAAHNGTLFLDEAYALNSGSGCGGRDSFSSDAIATLLTECENRRTSCMVILAGYEAPMKRLLDADPGLRRRFPSFLRLKDYSPTDLGRIAEQAARRRFGATFDDGVEAQLVAEIAGKHLASIAKHNASLSIRMVEAALTAMAERVMSEQESDAIDRNMNNDMTMMMANDEVSEKQLTTLKFVDFTSSQFASDL